MDNSINIRTVIDAQMKLGEIRLFMYAHGRTEEVDALTMAIEALGLLNSVKWIPCSERLPDEETDVFICNANGDRAISRGSYSTEAKDDFIWYTSGWRFGKVIAWMPLPKPYKAESEEV